MTVTDTRFNPYPSEGQWAVDFPMYRRAPTRDELYLAWQLDVNTVQNQYKRRLSKAELETAVPVRER